MNIMLKNPVAVMREGSYFILAEEDEIQAGNNNGDAQSVNVTTGEASGVLPMQAFFKWFTGLQDATQEEYEQAKQG